PLIISFRDRRKRYLDAVLKELEPGAHLFLHCSGTTLACGSSFRRLPEIRAAFPHVTLHLLANTDNELETFGKFGLPQAYGPVSLYVDESTFRPEPVEKIYDAVYVARFTPGD